MFLWLEVYFSLPYIHVLTVSFLRFYQMFILNLAEYFCIFNVNYAIQIRTEVNKVLEIARGEKLIGSSLDAKVYLHTSDANLASRLLEMAAATNDADNLHRIFITSQVSYGHL